MEHWNRKRTFVFGWPEWTKSNQHSQRIRQNVINKNNIQNGIELKYNIGKKKIFRRPIVNDRDS